MRGKNVAAVVGLLLALGGLGVLAYGILRATGEPQFSECSGDACLDDPWFLAFPLGVMAMVFGMIIASWAIGAIRAERGNTGPLRAFGFMTGLGGVFFVMGAIFAFAFGQGGGVTDGTFLFLGLLFGVMGLIFIGVDLLRFRNELKTDRLRISGLHGTAKVMGISDSNITINNSPMVNFDLEVTIPGQPPFRTKKRSVISRLSVGALMPGAILPVLADPNKPRDIVIDWDGGTPVDGGAGSTAAAAAMNTFFSGNWGMSGLSMIPGMGNSQILRSVAEALAKAAERADAGGITRTAGGTTVINSGPTVMVNGRLVDGSEAQATIAGLPGILAAAFGQAGGSGANFPIPDAAPPTPATPATPPAAAGTPAPQPELIKDVGATAGPETAGTSQLPARVTLDAMQDMGVDMSGGRLYTFDLQVSVAGRQAYPIKHAAVVPNAQIARLVRGASFPAQVDPTNPGQVAVRWDR